MTPVSAKLKTQDFLNRRLGRTETIYWLLDQLYCLNFVVFAELEGALNDEDLKLALDIVQQENPALRAKIAIDGSRQLCFKSVPESERPLEFEAHPLRDWRRKIEAQLATPFATEQAPLARFLWFRGKGKKSVVAMVFHHSVADGKSGACVLLDVLRRSVGQDRVPTFKTAHPSSQQLDLIQDKGLIKGKLKELKFWLNTGKSLLKFPKQLPGYSMKAGDVRKVKTIPFSISAKASAALLAVCRDRGTTMHGALGAALLLAINDEFEAVASRNLGLNSLADMRPVLKGGLTELDLGLYITTLTTTHRLGEKPNFWALAGEIPDRLKAIMRSGDANLINNIYTEMPLFTPDQSGARKLQKIVALAPPSSMLTNIGKINEQPLSSSLSIRSLAFAVSPPAQNPVCVTAASYCGTMHLNLLYDQCMLKGDQARRIAKNMLSKLLQEAGEDNMMRH